ncbi:MAG TPA: isoprenylcysteine carboxylmethyltransferase family protein [Gemmatimonadaceae bacterium]|nr:isoprenylcysteine carboxylmethyltransferase family protein [Gemmatimonadaceae bacterium]
MIDSSQSLVQRARVPLGFLFGALFLWFAPRFTTPEKLVVGGIIALIGVLIRAWSTGHIVKNQKLTTTGPYAHTRNPLYVGSFFLALGFAFAAHWIAVVLVIVFWVVVYKPTIEREREYLRSLYGDAYAEYERNVPAFFPRLSAWSGPAGEDRSGGFSFPLYLRHNEWQAGLGFLAVLGWLVFSPFR